MGGVVSRYALAFMEQRGIRTGVSHFLSIDAPEQGATIDSELQNFLKDVPCVLGGVDVPPSIASVAAKQLLTYSAFDGSSPSIQSRFYAELNALNGDGYPDQSENVGVAFSTAAVNPYVGQKWLAVHLPDALCNGIFEGDSHFYIQSGSPEAVAGSFLPRDATQLWGRSGGLMWELVRHADPTFIPYTSALDIVNGRSRFDGVTYTPPATTEHDFFDPALTDPLLRRIGFPPPPLGGWMSGPTSLPVSSTGTWRAHHRDGYGDVSYKWEWRAYYSFCGGGGGDPIDDTPFGEAALPSAEGIDAPGGGVGTEAVTCGKWAVSPNTSSTFTHREWYDATVDIRLTVRRGVESVVRYHSVRFGATSGGGDEGLSAPGGEPELSRAEDYRSIPETTELLEAAPNPTGGTSSVRYALSKPGAVTLELYDALGRRVTSLVRGEQRVAGTYTTPLDAGSLVPGVYLIRMEVASEQGTIRQTKTLTVAR
jgi:hypothetical protein